MLIWSKPSGERPDIRVVVYDHSFEGDRAWFRFAQPTSSASTSSRKKPIVSAYRLVVMDDPARILLQHCQAHGVMKPIKDMLGHRSDKFCQRADLLAPVSQECDVLIGL
jgi:hypothetical protein